MKHCLFCGAPLDSPRKQFCNHSCAAKLNNRSRRKHEQYDYCLNCGKKLVEEGQKRKRYKYCSKQCCIDHQYKQWIEAWKNGEETGTIAQADMTPRIRKYLFEKYNNQCQKCGWSEVNPFTGNIHLQVHHIDGDCLNNREENLQLLCPNCHSLTCNYGKLNKNSKRLRRKTI